MIEAMIGSVIAVAATGALAMLFEVGFAAISPSQKSLSEYEKRVVESIYGTSASNKYQAVEDWLSDMREGWRGQQ